MRVGEYDVSTTSEPLKHQVTKFCWREGYWTVNESDAQSILKEGWLERYNDSLLVGLKQQCLIFQLIYFNLEAAYSAYKK